MTTCDILTISLGGGVLLFGLLYFLLLRKHPSEKKDPAQEEAEKIKKQLRGWR